jgi:hypothetical protein
LRLQGVKARVSSPKIEREAINIGCNKAGITALMKNQHACEIDQRFPQKSQAVGHNRRLQPEEKTTMNGQAAQR